jgi:hypothetical protein
MAGTLGEGGNGGLYDTYPSGGGGGGYYGGGSGGLCATTLPQSAGGGGGGSSYVIPSATGVSMTQGGNMSFGLVTITW